MILLASTVETPLSIIVLVKCVGSILLEVKIFFSFVLLTSEIAVVAYPEKMLPEKTQRLHPTRFRHVADALVEFCAKKELLLMICKARETDGEDEAIY